MLCESNFPGRITYSGSGMLKLVKEKFTALDLLQRIAETPFAQFFEATTLNFSSVLLHSLLLRKVESTKRGEIHFGIGNKRVRFGKLEYALITGFSMEDGPTAEEQNERRSDRLVTDHLNGVRNAKFEVLTNAFKTCQDPEDAYKLGLCVFVIGYLLGVEHNRVINDKYLYMVEDLPFFYSLPWGNITWTETFSALSVDMKRYCLKQKDKSANENILQKEAKYSLPGNLHAVQYWAFEAIPEIGQQFGNNIGVRVPRMLSWSSVRVVTRKDVEKVFLKKTVIYNLYVL